MTSQIVSVCMVFENDAAIAADVVHELHATLSARFENFEILAVDNGSTNDTVSRVLAVAEPLDNIRILILAKQYDIEIASFAALENAIGDYVVLFEPRTDPCHVEPQLVAKCMEGHDLVSGKAEDRGDDTGWRPLFSALFRNLGRLSGVHNLQDVWSSCFCFNRTTLNAIIQIKDKVRSLRFISAEI
jgi:glycosyltransferase involved in cell wall biosynthesis